MVFKWGDVIESSPVGVLGSQAGVLARQIEFPLAVAVCAWCRPRELGSGLGAVSHGICPTHLRKLKLSLQRTPDAPARHKRRRAHAAGTEPLLFPLGSYE